MTKSLRAAGRLLRALLHVISGVFTIYTRFGKLDSAQRFVIIQAWSTQLLRIIGISVKLHGTPPTHGPLLLVCNHISWLDITVLHAVCRCRFVAKGDVKHWPVIGRLAIGGETLFIERESRRAAMRVVHHVAEALRDGDMVAVFPEGTTGYGEELLSFHANLIQAAISSDTPVQPLALRFTDAEGQHTRVPSYVGDDTLLASVWRTLRADALVANVWVGAAQQCDGRDRRAWAHALREDVAALRGV